MTEETAAPACRPPSGAGDAKARNFADRVRLGLQIEKARATKANIDRLADELGKLVVAVSNVSAELGSVIEGLERERDSAGPRETTGN